MHGPMNVKFALKICSISLNTGSTVANRTQTYDQMAFISAYSTYNLSQVGVVAVNDPKIPNMLNP